MTSIDRIRGLSGSLAVKAPVRVATTASITLSGLQTVDGVALAEGDRVLVKNQTDGTANGVYDVDTGAWSRSLDFDGNSDFIQGTLVSVVSGSTQGETMWRLSTASPVIGGSLSFDRFIPTDAGLVEYTPAGTGAVTRDVQSKLRESISVKDYGATGNGLTDDRVAIQAAIDAMSTAGGGTVRFPSGTYIVGDSGVDIASRSYGLLLKSNVALVGDDVSNTTIKAKAASDIDLINTSRAAPQSKISLRNLTLDGNESTFSGINIGFNLWAWDIADLTLENIKSINPASWGIRIEQCDGVHINHVTCEHSAESNSDGVHFVDTDNVTGGDIWIDTAGDDAFVIEALSSDVKNYALSGVYVKPLNGLAVPARGILLLGDGAVMTGARTISNINLGACVIESASGSGVVLSGASYESVKIDAIIRGGCSVAGLLTSPGNVTYAGSMENCDFEIVISDVTGVGVTGSLSFGTISDNRMRVTLSNPGDNKVGVSVFGDYWTGAISVDYNPNADKVTPAQGVVINQDFNDLDVSCRGALKNLFLQGTAQNNTIRLGYLRGGVTNDLEISGGAANNRFVGGQIQGAIVNSGGATNKFFGTLGADTYGVASLNFATDADGTAAFNHGLNGTPTGVQLMTNTGGVNHTYTVIGLTSTQIDVKAFAANTGAAITAGSFDYFFRATM